ncbi:Ppx/GppA family phosphatase [Alicyclobacillus tolerans]|uniref:Exopolyphosphatase/guanosine-5'-triphosphate, 3'-diphosphate pyrophosphatase n=2 Tax=Alicyclobacillus tolerans TaxID=90970 RepID=A0ABT9LXU9_9BACL|nr:MULTISPECIES: Ppx/GppA family phosphatase [Alicyclobacillus]MDP9729092.1 exopolyphosphatase/guanosine-5'-triphosphate,3'-diphosphate pyrophosphatase [Alicyclobacillus tengchongensis]SHK87225.1 exopolyphosphatase / guanosine-5'-triphosphate,3'-diphosphate pyrophosphatase [Alicyclobacillus montanus]
MSRIGIIDLGSNSARLMIYEIEKSGAYWPIFEMKQNIRLAEAMNDGIIQETGIQRAISCTRLFYRAGQLHNVDEWLAVATAAIRQSRNQSEILHRLRVEAGIAYQVIEGADEGRYGYIGAVNTLPIQNALLFDIGGASTELMLVESRKLKGVVSLPHGALNLMKRFENVSETETARLVYHFMQEALNEVSFLSFAQNMPLVGMGGTARALAKLELARLNKPSARIHGFTMDQEAVQQWFEELSSLPLAKRKKIKNLSKSRADIIVPGLAIMSALMKKTSSPSLMVSRAGLREGIFYERYLRYTGSAVVHDVLSHSLFNFQRKFVVNPTVSDLVADAALRLFDALVEKSLVDAADRTLFYTTVQVESAGCYIHTERWMHHSAYLAQWSQLYGLGYHETEDMVQLLSGKANKRLKRLSLLLRLAKLLTLQLGMNAEEIEIVMNQDSLMIGRIPDMNHQVEKSADASLVDEFLLTFQIPLIFLDA